MVRVRFAPSPTGFLHIGSIRSCLYNWLFARKNKGKLILRIEDTDRSRYVPESIPSLLSTLKECEIDWDEGPVLSKNQKFEVQNLKFKGNYGPYIQSQRLHIYRNFAQKLVDIGAAYYCFCSKERLEKMRQIQIKKKLPPKYDGHCRKLTPLQVQKKLEAKEPFVIRLKVPWERKKVLKFKDIIRGEIEFDLKSLDDQILLKSDGWPTFHLASVIDDHLMKITHIIRGEEWLSSVPKHLLIYQALGWKPPKMAHLPLLLNPDRSKLSKRQGDVAVEDYLRKGYLPEAILNFVALLGWNPGNDEEIFTIPQLIRQFSLKKVRKSGAIFNLEKLNWMNGYYIRKMKLSDLTRKCIPYLIQSGLIGFIDSKLKNKHLTLQQIQVILTNGRQRKYKIQETGEIVNFKWIESIISLEQERLTRLGEISEKTCFFFKEPVYKKDLLFWKNINLGQLISNLQLMKKSFSKIPPNQFVKKKLENILLPITEERGRGEVLWPLRVALTGKKGSPPPIEIAEILGKEKTLKRIESAIQMLYE